MIPRPAATAVANVGTDRDALNALAHYARMTPDAAWKMAEGMARALFEAADRGWSSGDLDEVAWAAIRGDVETVERRVNRRSLVTQAIYKAGTGPDYPDADADVAVALLVRAMGTLRARALSAKGPQRAVVILRYMKACVLMGHRLRALRRQADAEYIVGRPPRLAPSLPAALR